MTSLAISVFLSMYETWCHLSAAGEARPWARCTSHTSPTTRRLGRGRRVLGAPEGPGAAAASPGQAQGPRPAIALCRSQMPGHPPGRQGRRTPWISRARRPARGRCRCVASIDLNAAVAARSWPRPWRVVYYMVQIICDLTQLSSTQCQCHWSPRPHRQSHCDTCIRGTQSARRHC